MACMTSTIRVPERERHRDRRLWSWAFVLALWTGLGGLGAARAELVVMADGGHLLKVASYELVGERMRLELEAGGALTVPLSRIERILDDEIDPLAAEAPVAEPESFSMFDTEDRLDSLPYDSLLTQKALAHGLNPRLLAAVARAESDFDPLALSHKGARGLLQLMPATAERFGIDPKLLWEPEHNVEAGARYLAFLGERYKGQLALVLAAYNAGEGAVARHGGVPPYRETRGYLQRVLDYLGVDEATGE